jgi:hypothetical protein
MLMLMNNAVSNDYDLGVSRPLIIHYIAYLEVQLLAPIPFRIWQLSLLHKSVIFSCGRCCCWC